ncbi:MAG: hypothetical protein ACFCD0_03795 [Gemmataceae bacterium]
MADFERVYLRDPDFRYQIRTNAVHGFIVGPYEGEGLYQEALGGILGDQFVIVRFDEEGNLLPDGVMSWPVPPMPEEVRVSSDSAWSYLANVAESHSMGIFAGTPINVKRFFLKQGAVELGLGWPPGPVQDGHCEYYPIGIDDVPWQFQLHRAFPEKYSPEEQETEEADLQTYWEKGGDKQFLLWWGNHFFIEQAIGMVTGT